MKLATFGAPGSYTHQAAEKCFGAAADRQSYRTVAALFAAVESGVADAGVVPIENSSEGIVDHTVDQFVGSPIIIYGEISLVIRHALLGVSAVPLADVREVHAHPQALGQCRNWLAAHVPDADLRAAGNNSEAAARLAAGQLPEHAAVLGNDVLARQYNLVSLADGVADGTADGGDNITRFLVIGRADHPIDVPKTGDRRVTSLVMAADNQPGALFRLIRPLAEHGVSMNRIESRPSRQKAWEYCFFIDVDGDAAVEPVATALRDMAAQAAWFKNLGTYSSAVLK